MRVQLNYICTKKLCSKIKDVSSEEAQILKDLLWPTLKRFSLTNKNFLLSHYLLKMLKKPLKTQSYPLPPEPASNLESKNSRFSNSGSTPLISSILSLIWTSNKLDWLVTPTRNMLILMII